MDSIPFYNKHHKAYIEKTLQLDMSKRYRAFEALIEPGCHILDLGCGSGRDSEYFIRSGYQITAMDGSKMMTKSAESLLNRAVIHASFESFEINEVFDAIWASASLLHVPREDMVHIIEKYVGYLKEGGIFYMSFKKQERDFSSEGRFFTCYTKDTLGELLEGIHGIEIMYLYETESIQTDHMTWVNAYTKKINRNV